MDSYSTNRTDHPIDPYKRALVMVESSELTTALSDSPVLTKAMSMQDAFGCDLKLFCCVEEHELTPVLLTAFEERLDEIRATGSAVEGTINCQADAAEAAITSARDFAADIVVKQVDEANPYYLGIADHSDWRLMRNDVASVWFVKQPGAAIDRVVAAVGHSGELATRRHTYLDEQSYHVYEAARHAANGLDSSLHALHVVESAGEELPAYDIAANGNIMSFARADSGTGHGQRENAKANYHGRQLSAFAQHVDALGNDLDVRAGTAEDVIADFSREADADLLVMGARPMTRWERLRTAPVAEPVLAEAPCDVLAICGI